MGRRLDAFLGSPHASFARGRAAGQPTELASDWPVGRREDLGVAGAKRDRSRRKREPDGDLRACPWFNPVGTSRVLAAPSRRLARIVGYRYWYISFRTQPDPRPGQSTSEAFSVQVTLWSVQRPNAAGYLTLPRTPSRALGMSSSAMNALRGNGLGSQDSPPS